MQAIGVLSKLHKNLKPLDAAWQLWNWPMVRPWRNEDGDNGHQNNFVKLLAICT